MLVNVESSAVGSEVSEPLPLQSAKLTVKYFLDDPNVDIGVDDLIKIFHRWIRDRVFPHELMLDVADYSHVPSGPGVMLICVNTHYAVELSGGGVGVRYARKREGEGTSERRLKTAFRSTIQMAQMLEKEPALSGRYRFRTDEIEFGIYDRLHAPNTSATFADVQPFVEGFVSRLYGAEARVLHNADPLVPFSVKISTSARPSLDDLLARLPKRLQVL